MARIFTTTFLFNERHYDAIITISRIDETLNFSIRLMDQELFDLVPGGHIKYKGKDGFRQLASLNNNNLTQVLLKSIVSAIEEYVEQLA